MTTEIEQAPKVRRLLAVVFVCLLAEAFTPSTHAQDKKPEKGANGPITKQELIEHFQRKRPVDGYVISGDDIIETIKETDLDITIENSVIEGGLDFGELPKTPLEKVKRPETWSGKEKTEWRKRQPRWLKEISIVTNKITIVGTDILPEQQSSQSADSVAISAEKALFQDVDFQGSIFSGKASFGSATFSGKASFGGATFGGWAFFDGATFGGEAFFGGGATFSKGASFGRATFGGRSSFHRATFGEGAVFGGATFDRLAYFKGARFLDTLVLVGTVFKAYTDFRDAEVTKLDFNNELSPAIIDSRVDFRKVKITEAHFQDIVFASAVDFSGAEFGVAAETEPAGEEADESIGDEKHAGQKNVTADSARRHGTQNKKNGGDESLTSDALQIANKLPTVFRFVTFEGNAYFVRTKFSGPTSLESVNFQREANFTEADLRGLKKKGKGVFSLSHVNFSNLNMRWSQLPNPASWVTNRDQRIKSFVDLEAERVATVRELDLPKYETLQPLSQAIRGLEANFRSQKQLGDANEANYHMKVAELHEARENKRLTFWQRLPTEVEWVFFGIVCGYGTKIWWVLGWSLLVNFLFSWIYTTTSVNLKRKSRPEITFKQRLFDFPKDYLSKSGSPATKSRRASSKGLTGRRDEPARKFVNALRFSSVILFKVGYRDTTVSGRIGWIDLKYIVALEWALGFYLLAALMVTLANTQPLINRLITGVF